LSKPKVFTESEFKPSLSNGLIETQIKSTKYSLSKTPTKTEFLRI